MVVVGLPHDVAHIFYFLQGGLVEYQRRQWPFRSFSDVAFEEIHWLHLLFRQLTFPFLVEHGHGPQEHDVEHDLDLVGMAGLGGLGVDYQCLFVPGGHQVRPLWWA